MTCTFFGHRDFDGDEIMVAKLEGEIEKLILEHDVNTFYVGNHGNFDKCVYYTLKRIKEKYPHIEYKVVLAYSRRPRNRYFELSECIFPEDIDGIEGAPQRARIIFRNTWMISKARYVITYITRVSGNAAKFALEADQKDRRCINIAFG